MAGIGFELRRLNRNNTLLGTIRAYGASGLITSGPWIISILSIAVLSVLLAKFTSAHDRNVILSSVTHIYAFMLILTGAPSLVLTRYAADAFSEKKPERILPSYLSSLTVLSILAALSTAAFFHYGVAVSPLFTLSATALAVLVAATFITANYLGALKHYNSILAAFFCGYAVSGALAIELMQVDPGNPALALIGFVIGHLLLVTMLFASLYRELPRGEKLFDLSCFKYFLRFPALAAAGLCYNAGIWIDKLLFWWLSPDNHQVLGAMYSAPDYDVAVYLSILSIVPGMAVFCLKLETDFAEFFTKYFKALNSTGTLNELHATKDRIAEALRGGLSLLAKVQGTTTVLLLIFAEPLTRFLYLGAFQIGVLRVTLVGSFFLVMFLALLTVLFYFDDRRCALVAAGLFLLTNGLVTLLSLLSGAAYFGVGYVLASAAAFAFTALRANHLLEHLEYRIFNSAHTPATT